MYGKLFAQMYDGTLATKGPWQALITFQQLIILADQDGVVDMTPEAISRRTTIPMRHITAGLAALEQPDPESRTPTADGRRITRISDTREWGWQIVNYDHYRKLRTADERREYHKEYARNKRNTVSTDVNTSQQDSTESTNSSKQYAEAEAKTPQPPKANGGGRLQAAELLKDVRILVSPMHPNSLEKDWPKHFSEGQLRVIRAVGTERILNTRPENDGPLLAQVAQMLAEVA